MKVLFISHNDPGVGGAPKSLIELIKNLKDNYNVYPVVCVHSKDIVYNFCKRNNIDCYVTKHLDISIGSNKNIISWFKFIPCKFALNLYNRKAYKILQNKVDLRSISLIHSNVSVVGLGMYINKKTGIPHVMHIRENPSLLKKTMYLVNPIKRMNRFVTRYIAISNFVKEGWTKAGLDNKKIDLIYNGLKLPSKIHHRILKNKKVRIVIVGSLQKSKGQDFVIDAINKIKEPYRSRISLDIIGTGSKNFYNKLLNLIKKNNLLNINLLGYKKNIDKLLSNYDIGIMASEGEAFGRVTVEYMSQGLVVLAANSGADPEIIKNRETGFLFDRKNVISLTNMIRYVIDNPKKSNKIAQNGQNAAYKYFTTNLNAYNVYKEYKKILK